MYYVQRNFLSVMLTRPARATEQYFRYKSFRLFSLIFFLFSLFQGIVQPLSLINDKLSCFVTKLSIKPLKRKCGTGWRDVTRDFRDLKLSLDQYVSDIQALVDV